jgi:hypothetical protein
MIEIPDKSLLELNREGRTFAELAELTGVTRGVIAGRIFRYRQSQTKNGVQANPALFKVNIGTPLELSGNWMVVGDVHVPCTDYDFAQLPALMAKKHKIKNLLIAGDLYSMDAFSKYPKRVDHATWHQEKNAAIQLMSEWVRVFDRVVLLMGNHERRLEKLAEGAYDDSDIFAQLLGSGKVETSPFGWCTIKTPTGMWRATHQRNYSKIQLRVASELAHKYQMNIISHHEHHLAMGWDRFKNYVIVSNGGLFDVNKMAYVNMDDSTSAGMTKGFTMLKGGYPFLFGEEPFTDWGHWL